MTPKEKARELVNKFKQVELFHSMEPTDFDYKIQDISSASFTAKQCALIAVEEILGSMGADRGYAFWTEVKQEIEQL